jgi:hypothetical protein
MATFFSPFPKTMYSGSMATNIMVRYRVRELIYRYSKVFDDYIISDGEKPFVVADKYYKRPELSELILLTNMMLDPYYDWPMSTNEFDEYIVKTYGSTQTAMQTEYAYYRIIQNKEVFSDGSIVPAKELQIDKTAFLKLPLEEKRMVYAYDYEMDRNENRRRISLIKKMYIPKIETEIKNIFAQ